MFPSLLSPPLLTFLLFLTFCPAAILRVSVVSGPSACGQLASSLSTASLNFFEEQLGGGGGAQTANCQMKQSVVSTTSFPPSSTSSSTSVSSTELSISSSRSTSTSASSSSTQEVATSTSTPTPASTSVSTSTSTPVSSLTSFPDSNPVCLPLEGYSFSTRNQYCVDVCGVGSWCMCSNQWENGQVCHNAVNEKCTAGIDYCSCAQLCQSGPLEGRRGVRGNKSQRRLEEGMNFYELAVDLSGWSGEAVAAVLSNQDKRNAFELTIRESILESGISEVGPIDMPVLEVSDEAIEGGNLHVGFLISPSCLFAPLALDNIESQIDLAAVASAVGSAVGVSQDEVLPQVVASSPGSGPSGVEVTMNITVKSAKPAVLSKLVELVSAFVEGDGSLSRNSPLTEIFRESPFLLQTSEYSSSYLPVVYTIPLASSTSVSLPPTSSSSLSSWDWVAIILGSIAGLLLVAGCLFFLVKKYRNKTMRSGERDFETFDDRLWASFSSEEILRNDCSLEKNRDKFVFEKHSLDSDEISSDLLKQVVNEESGSDPKIPELLVNDSGSSELSDLGSLSSGASLDRQQGWDGATAGAGHLRLPIKIRRWDAAENK